MKRIGTKRKRVTSKRRGSKVSEKPKSIFIVECDIEKLRKDNLHMGHWIQASFQFLIPNRVVHLIQPTTKDDLRAQFAEKVKPEPKESFIFFIGHSNPSIIQMASDHPCPWSEAATWFDPFKPKAIFLAACKAGQSLPVKSLFDGIPTLNTIYASPDIFNKQQSMILAGLLIADLKRKRTKRMLENSSNLQKQLLKMSANIYEWKRDDFSKGKIAPLIWDQLAELRKLLVN